MPHTCRRNPNTRASLQAVAEGCVSQPGFQLFFFSALLFSAGDSRPDTQNVIASEEFALVQLMDLAAREERFADAGMFLLVAQQYQYNP